jgi:hypothetical protein
MRSRRAPLFTGHLRFPRHENPEKEAQLRELSAFRMEFPAGKLDKKWNGQGTAPHVRYSRLVSGLLKDSPSKLRSLCEKHGLLEGTKTEMIKRLYLHVRAVEYGKGNPIGWGEGFSQVSTPTCRCISSGPALRFPRVIQRFPRLYFPRTQYFPRSYQRFPRMDRSLEYCYGCGKLQTLIWGELRKAAGKNQTWTEALCPVCNRKRWLRVRKSSK